MTAGQPASIEAVVRQHVEEAAHLRNVRSRLVHAPNVRLANIGRHDARMAAHLEGIALAGVLGTALARAALERVGVGEVFVACVRAIDVRDFDVLDGLIALGRADPALQSGLLSAFGWTAPGRLRGVIKTMLESADPAHREVGLVACSMHDVDSGVALLRALRDESPSLRATALRVAGRSGRTDLVGTGLALLSDGDPACRFEAARAAVLLGDRGEAVSVLETLALDAQAAGGNSDDALLLVSRLVPPVRARSLLSSLAQRPTAIRSVIRGSAAAGDSRYVPWLLRKMGEPALARLCGEAFSLITGLDLVATGMELKVAQGERPGANGEPSDERETLDDDDGLPWPDPHRLSEWWTQHAHRFPAGTRHFMGAPPSPGQCQAVIDHGLQRQRQAAAEHLALLVPGAALFNTAAPAWRQREILAARRV